MKFCYTVYLDDAENITSLFLLYRHQHMNDGLKTSEEKNHYETISEKGTHYT